MRAAKYIGGGRIEVGAAEPSAPAAGEVRIRVAFNGICGTDLHIVQGHMDARVAMPATIGHEMSGTVESVGDGVDLAPGAQVTVMPLRWCGECASCRAGHQHICQRLDFVGAVTCGDQAHERPLELFDDVGGERAAAIYSLITTANLNDVDPRAWLADVLARINDHPAARLDNLMPWNWKAARSKAAA